MQTEGTATRSGPAAVLLRLARRAATRETAAVAALSLMPALLYLPFLNEPLFGDRRAIEAHDAVDPAHRASRAPRY
ncbi:MAG TPA: hypothetical protein QGI71_08540 [Dehalococcoidia bacterium]|jgi:hypothetical protein|nr:hypothetical protein [Dehalococcoidia bacterium]